MQYTDIKLKMNCVYSFRGYQHLDMDISKSGLKLICSFFLAENLQKQFENDVKALNIASYKK